MNSKQSTIDKIKVMQAYVDGEATEYQSKSSSPEAWSPANPTPAWCWDYGTYRIKPAATKMTVAEINKRLGMNIEVVAG